jgi:hypothetical protein
MFKPLTFRPQTSNTQRFKHIKTVYIKGIKNFSAISTKLQCDKNETMGQRMKQERKLGNPKRSILAKKLENRKPTKYMHIQMYISELSTPYQGYV